MRRRAAAGVALFLATSIPALGLDDRAITQFSVRSWGPEQGLPSASGYALAQTPDGYLWIGTTEGLARFDGLRFRVFDRRNTASFPSNEVRRLLVAADGSLVVGFTAGGLLRFRRGEFEPVVAPSGERKLLTALAAGPHGSLVASWPPALVRFDGTRATSWSAPELQVVTEMATGSDGTVWAAGQNGRVIGFSPSGARRELATPRGEGIAVHAALTAVGNEIWAAGTRNLLRCSEGSCRAWGPTWPRRDPMVASLLRDRQGYAWAALGNGGGIARLAAQRAESFGAAQGAPTDRVQQLLEDREGAIWAISWDAGLIRLSDGPFTTTTSREGLAGDAVRTVLESRDGSLWVGTTQGLSRFEHGSWRTFHRGDGLPAEWIYSLAETPAGEVWIGTREGLAVRHGATFVSTPVPGNAAAGVFALLVDRAGRLWVGTDAGLFLRDQGTFRRLPLPPGIVYALQEDRQGSLWIGTGQGLFELPSGTATPVRRPIPSRSAQEIVFSMHQDSRGDLWIGTLEGGLLRLREGRSELYTTADGLFDDTAYAILEDERAGLWVSCGRGIYRLDLRDVDSFDAKRTPYLKSRVFGVEDGLGTRAAEGGNGGAGARLRDGRMAFATMKGLAMLDPQQVGEPGQGPPTIVETVIVDGVGRPAGRSVLLSPGRHRFEVEYTAIHLRATERLAFRHRLSGVDDDWIAAVGRRAEYPALGVGSHRFEVQAAVDGGSWGPASAVEVVVSPALWERKAFLPLLLLSAAAAGAALLRVRLVRLRRRAKELEAMAELGRRVAGVLEPEEIVRQLDHFLVERWGEVPRILVAHREGRAALVHARRVSGEPPPFPAGESLAALTTTRRLETVDPAGGWRPWIASGLTLTAPLRSGGTTFGLLAVGPSGRGRRTNDLAHLGALASQTAMALEGAWQAQEAIRWRQLSEARGEWLQSDLLSRLVFAAVARHALAGQARLDEVRSAVEELFGQEGSSLGRVESAAERLVAARVLVRDEVGALRVERSSWLLLPEVRAPLAEIARLGTRVVGAYRLGERLGAGGMGEVFRAVNVHDGSTAAVKLLYAEQTADESARRRLEREGDLVASIAHPNVVRLLGRGEHEGRLYLAMELVVGETLSERLRGGPLAVAEAIGMAEQLASALAELHRHGVVHRDVKSGNVMLEPEGRAVLLDLGLARGVGGSTLTRSLAVLGTLPYMSPEQIQGEEADSRSDLWSLGVVLAESLMGRLPFGAGQSTVQVALEIARLEAPPRLAGLPAQPGALRLLLDELLEPSRERRRITAADAAAQLARLRAVP